MVPEQILWKINSVRFINLFGPYILFYFITDNISDFHF